MTLRPRYVPAHYTPSPLAAATLWERPDWARARTLGGTAAERTNPDSALAPLIEQAIEKVQALLGHRISRALHVVIYAAPGDSAQALERDLEPTFLLAPLHTQDAALIALHSSALDARNADPDRMLRHLSHEMTHVCNAEKSGSVKCLGDGDVGMRVVPWVDEGLAVNVAGMVTGREVPRVPLDERSLPLTELDEIFRDLASPRRAWAFSIATSLVARAIGAHGLPFVFENATQPERWSSSVSC